MSISSDPKYLIWAAPMLKRSNWEAPVAWVRNICQTTLQAMQMGRRATAYSFFATFVVYIANIIILYYINNHDFVNLMYVYPMTSIVSMIMAFFWMITPTRNMIKALRENSTLNNDNKGDDEEKKENDENDEKVDKETNMFKENDTQLDNNIDNNNIDNNNIDNNNIDNNTENNNTENNNTENNNTKNNNTE